MLVVSWIMTRVRFWENIELSVGFRGCCVLRVIGHEEVPVDPKKVSSWVHRSVVLLKRGFGRQTSSRWRLLLTRVKTTGCIGSASNASAASGGI
jgi:hypothetical protein